MVRARKPRAWRALACALALAAMAVAGCSDGESREVEIPRLPKPALGGERPNIVVVMTDDQSLHSFDRETMPETFRRVVDPGTDFTNAVVSPPICCPSRAGFLTGQYPHNHGIFGNNPGYVDLIDPGQVLPAWLQAAGYRTEFAGKYLNHTVSALDAEPAPGWDDFFILQHLQYFGETAYDNGEAVDLGPDTFTPRALNDRAVADVEDAAGPDPFFLYLATTAPHFRNDDTEVCNGRGPKAATEADYERFRDTELDRSPSFDEADISDKPASLARKKRFDRAEIRAIERGYRCTLASLQEVDRGVARIWDALEQAGEAKDTVFVFTSDNGLFFGEHRLATGKGRAYEPAIRVPLAIRLPAKAAKRAPAELDEVVSNQDLTATLLSLAGAQPCLEGVGCRTIDGRSTTGLLEGGGGSWPDDRGILIEQGTDGCNYAAIRTARYMFNQQLRPGEDGCVEVARELYDLRDDPDQLDNIVHESRADRDLRKRLKQLRECSGQEGPQACE